MKRTATEATDLITGVRLDDCCQRYIVSVSYVMERGHGEPDRALVRSVEIEKASSLIHGVWCEIVKPEGGWPQGLLDYLCGEAQCDDRNDGFLEKAQA